MAYFRKIRMESAVIERNFTENNLVPDKRPPMDETGSKQIPATASDDDLGVTLLDDD